MTLWQGLGEPCPGVVQVDKTTTYGLSPGTLERLLGIGVGDGSGEDAKATKEQLLCARLDGTLPLDTAVVRALPVLLGKLQKEMLPLGGKSLGDALLDPSTDLEDLKRVKDHAKQQAARKASESEHAVAIAIYYAAIASALLFCGERITAYSYEKLAASFDMLVDKRWIAPELARHLSKARKFCRKQMA